jgi:two-component system OmpR family response regulator
VAERSPTLAVVDCDAHQREVLQLGLEGYGFLVRAANDAVTALQLVEREAIDAIVLDLAVRTRDGLALIARLRRMTDAPIIALAPENDVASCIAILNAGADGAMPGALALDELAARLWSALRRPQLREITTIAYDDLVIDTARRHVERAGETIALTAHEFDLLTLLAREAGRVFTRGHLVERLWSPRSVKAGTIDAYISVLRAKVDKPPRGALIRTVRGVGYTLRRD